MKNNKNVTDAQRRIARIIRDQQQQAHPAQDGPERSSSNPP